MGELTKEEKKLLKQMRIIDSDINFPIDELISPVWNPNVMTKSDGENLEKSIDIVNYLTFF